MHILTRLVRRALREQETDLRLLVEGGHITAEHAAYIRLQLHARVAAVRDNHLTWQADDLKWVTPPIAG